MNSLDLPMPPEVNIFLEKMLEDAGITPDAELKEMMIEGLYQRLQARLLQVLAENLDKQDLETYTNLAAESQVKAVEFLANKNPNFPVLFAQAMAEFRQTFVEK